MPMTSKAVSTASVSSPAAVVEPLRDLEGKKRKSSEISASLGGAGMDAGLAARGVLVRGTEGSLDSGERIARALELADDELVSSASAAAIAGSAAVSSPQEPGVVLEEVPRRSPGGGLV